MNLKSTILGAVGIAMCINAAALAAPPFWESNYGTELTNLTGEDDSDQRATLSFNFSYAGIDYTDIYVGTNGAVGLGDRGDAGTYPSGTEFWDTDAPILSTFWSDMNLESIGTVYFNDFGDRAVVTWDGIGSYEDEYSPNTFQLQIFDNGTIIFGYNGIQDVSDSYFDTDVHIGLTEGNNPTELNVDYTAGDFTTSNSTILETFEYNDNDFDLDGKNIIFIPIISGGGGGGGNGYSVSVIPTPGAASILALGGLIASRRRRN